MNHITLDVIVIEMKDIEKLEAVGLINHTRLRDILIHQEYKASRDKGLSCEESKEPLREKYKSIGEISLHKICSSKINVIIV